MPTPPIRWRLHIPAPPEQVYAALSTDSGRAAFWAESAVETDGVIHFRFINGYRCEARILEQDPPRAFALDYMDGPARFTLEPDGRGGTDLLLVQEGVKPENFLMVVASEHRSMQESPRPSKKSAHPSRDSASAFVSGSTSSVRRGKTASREAS